MAQVKIKTVRAALNTSAGTQDITLSGFGTPKAAMFFVTRASVDDTLANHAALSMGFADGTASAVCAFSSENGLSANADTQTTVNSTDVIHFDDFGPVELVSATFSAWITDGVRINVVDAPSSGYLVTVVLIGGTDVTNADVSLLSLDRSIANDITTIGFEPDLVFAIATEASAAGKSNHVKASLGIAHNGASLAQRCMTIGIEHASSTNDVGLYGSDTQIGAVLNNAASSVQTGYTIGTFDASGYTITGDNGGSATRLMPTLNLKFANSPGIKILDIDSPTATGSAATTGAGFEPAFGMLLTADIDARNAVQDTDDDGFGITVFDDTSVFSNVVSVDDGVATTLARSLSSDQLRLIDGGTNATHTASLTSLDADGWTFNYSVADATTKKWFGLAIEGSVASRSITDIDSDDSVLVAQTSVTITAVGLDASPSTQTVTLGGEALTVTSWNSGNPIVTIPVNIALKLGRTDLQLSVTDDTGTVTLENVTLLPESGWEYVNFSGTVPGASTESGYEIVQTDFTYDLVSGDQWIFETETGLSFDTDTIPTINPAATITSQYRYWRDGTGAMSAKTAYTIAQKPLLSLGSFTAS